MGLVRILLLVAAGVTIYWLVKKRENQKKEVPQNLEWQAVFREELPQLRGAVPAGYYVSLLALSRSRISRICQRSDPAKRWDTCSDASA